MLKERAPHTKKTPHEVRLIAAELAKSAISDGNLRQFLFTTYNPVPEETKQKLKKRFLVLLPYMVEALEENNPPMDLESLYTRMRTLITHDLLHAAVSVKRGREVPVPLFLTEKDTFNNPELIREELYALLSYYPVANTLTDVSSSFEDATMDFFKLSEQLIYQLNEREFQNAPGYSEENLAAFKKDFYRTWRSVITTLEPAFKQLMQEIYDEAHRAKPRYDRMARFLLEETEGVQPLIFAPR